MAAFIRPDVATMVANFEALYNRATPQQILDGIAWYPGALVDCVDLAHRHNLHVNVAVAVVAATSPLTRWLKDGQLENIRRAEAMIVEYELTGVVTRGHFAPQVSKVNEILSSGTTDVATLVAMLIGDTGYKTANFMVCILGIRGQALAELRTQIQHKAAFTIRGTCTDRFHTGAAYGQYFGDKVPGHSAKQYDAISEATEQFAANHGLSPEEAQAILWIVFRKVHNVKD